MKKAILLAILFAFLMTGCDDDSEDSEIIRQLETSESVTASGEVSCEITETCSDTIPPEVPEIFCTEEIMEFSEIQEIITTNEEIRMFLSPLVRETLAAVSGAIIKLYETDGSVGAAKGAGIGAGIYKDHDEAFATLKKIAEITPPADREPYLKAYELWKERLSRIEK